LQRERKRRCEGQTKGKKDRLKEDSGMKENEGKGELRKDKERVKSGKDEKEKVVGK
jgi:hypothetical protein